MQKKNRTKWKRLSAAFTALVLALCCVSPLRAAAMRISSTSATREIVPFGIRARTTVSVPILMYHSVVESYDADTADDMQVTADVFRSHMEALKQAGYTAVSYGDLYTFVENGAPLPSRAVIITFDDGYRNNLTLAAPILAEYGYSAEVAVIGCTLGLDTYKETGASIIPHFTAQEAIPWVSSGVLRLNSHSYDMHQVASLDGEVCRKGVSLLPGETAAQYESAFKRDYWRSRTQLDRIDGRSLPVYTYPYGRYNELSEQALKDLDVPVTVTMDPGVAQVTRYESDSLRLLPRITVTGSTTPQRLLELAGGGE